MVRKNHVAVAVLCESKACLRSWFCHDRETTFHASFVGSKFSFSSMSWLPVFIFCRLGVLLGLSDKDRRAHIAWSNIKLYLRIVILQN